VKIDHRGAANTCFFVEFHVPSADDALVKGIERDLIGEDLQIDRHFFILDLVQS